MNIAFVRIPSFTAVVCALGTCFATAGTANPHPPDSGRSALESALWDDLADGRLDEVPLVEAALIAGGVRDESELERLRGIMHDHANRLRRWAEARGTSDPGPTVLEYLHAQILTGPYDAACFAVGRTLDAGPYNCVTSTVLFNALCESLALDVTATAREGHVFSRLADGDRDVETTCATWFQAPASAARPPARPLDSAQLLGKIYFNRGLVLLDGNHFGRAVECFEAACRLDPQDAAARRNLCAALNNWALCLADQGRFERATRVLLRGMKLDPAFDAFRANDLHIHHQWVTALCRDRRYADAIAVLDAGHQRRPEASLFDLGRLAVYRLWAGDQLGAGRFDAATDVFRTARRHLPDRPEVTEVEIELIEDHAQRLWQQNDWDLAAELVERALAEHPEIESLKNWRAHLTSPES